MYFKHIQISDNQFIPREITPQIEEAHRFFKVIVLTGPRQSGKTSLCRFLFRDYVYVNLEDITTRAAASTDPAGFIDSLGQHAVIDEVQHVPEILSIIQVRVDADKSRRYVLTGSSNFSLVQNVSQSLAGRAALFTLLPFSIPEVSDRLGSETNWEIIRKGMYPGVIADAIPPYLFYQNYYNTYVERDLRSLLKVRNIVAFDTFMRLLAARVGSAFSASALARETGVSSVTIAEWLSILETSYIAFSLRPYFRNQTKKLTKMPKYYFYDCGLLCFLLGIESAGQLEESEHKRSIYENMAVCELMKRSYNSGRIPQINFYRETSGKEIDAIVATSRGMELYEVKATETFRPEFVRNMNDLAPNLGKVASSVVVYNGPTIPGIAVNLRDL